MKDKYKRSTPVLYFQVRNFEVLILSNYQKARSQQPDRLGLNQHISTICKYTFFWCLERNAVQTARTLTIFHTPSSVAARILELALRPLPLALERKNQLFFFLLSFCLSGVGTVRRMGHLKILFKKSQTVTQRLVSKSYSRLSTRTPTCGSYSGDRTG